MELLRQAVELVARSQHLVIFTGAGVSTESGIPDYRGPDGVWTRRDLGLPPPQSPPLSMVEPNAAHMALVELQNMGLLKFLISQNVDNLHLKSGIEPKFLAELHGNVNRIRCCRCERTYPKGTSERCRCGCARFKSSIVNFGDNLPKADLAAAWEQTLLADVFFVIGSSLVVSPACDLPRAACERGAKLIILNMGDTPLDGIARLRITAQAGKFLVPMVEQVREIIAHNAG